MRHHRLTLLAVAATVGLSAACGGGGNSSGSNAPGTPTPPTAPTPSAPDPNTVLATPSITFEPAVLTVPRGTTVTFAFQSVGHNVFFDVATGAPANITAVLSNTNVTRTFAATGTFGYECHVHPGMRGTVVVQ